MSIKTISQYQVPQNDETPSDEMIEWLNKMTQEWEGDESGISIYRSSEQDEPDLAGPGDWIIEIGGVYHCVKASDQDKFLLHHGFFKYETAMEFFETKSQVSMEFSDSELQKVQLKAGGESVVISAFLFTEVFGDRAISLIEEAMTFHQNETLGAKP